MLADIGMLLMVEKGIKVELVIILIDMPKQIINTRNISMKTSYLFTPIPLNNGGLTSPDLARRVRMKYIF